VIISVDQALPNNPQKISSMGSQGNASRLRYPALQVNLAGVVTDLLERDDALEVIIDAARGGSDEVLGVASINLDHIHHFGSGKPLQSGSTPSQYDPQAPQHVRWLNLLDGAPLAKRAGELTGHQWPRLAGSDLIEPILDAAEINGLSVGFVGGSAAIHADLATNISKRWPNLRVGGYWAPDRADLTNLPAAEALTSEIARADVAVLVVCLGKPRQEHWIADPGYASGAKVCLAFGAVVDFLAERIARAPRWIASHGLEWAWRLLREPRRLARRYLVQGPAAYLALQRNSGMRTDANMKHATVSTEYQFLNNRRFQGQDGHADVCALVVTYNSATHIDELVESLRRQLADQTIRVVVIDNDSVDETLAKLNRHKDVTTVATGSNLGYAGGINFGRKHIGNADAILVLNPDLELADGAIKELRSCLAQTSAGIAVPRLLDADDSLHMSLRREPNNLRALGDALFGRRLRRRPGALSEIDMDERSYQHRHIVDWATGAALLVDAELDRRVGGWDERFFLYSEEVDFMRRVRESGSQIWFEPGAVMRHRRGGSGASDMLEALMAVNRVRYQEKWRGGIRALVFRGVVVLGSALRAWQPRHRTSIHYLLRRGTWPTMSAAVGACPEGKP
jgi:exopolysaccharide biosynthesis WecB/TagA/CpsF family protein